MPDLAPVVLAFDLAPESEPALVAAVDLAARAGGTLHLVTARPPDAPDVYRAPSDPEAAVRAVVEVTVDRALGAGACAEIAPHIAVARGSDPAAEVVRYADDVGAGTVVLGTSGRQGVQRFRLGSVAETVVRRSACPALVVPNRSPDRTPGAERPVLVPVDFSDHSARALAVARSLADLYGAAIEVLHVADGLAHADAEGDPPSSEALRAFARDAGAGDVAAHLAEGDPAAEIARHAEDAGAVVMGTHGRGGLARAVFGSVAEATLRQVRCPVLVVRPAR
ncbi:universal stress protein [Rubrivirga sp. S365]|uniref:Universal stress protein n=1 Tax=Rubrivirga litoralis TaxID=3075598 RepID=A0ABU3BNQ1_9BACT|nr:MULTISPECIES: universal stress protein [unclassified Rubrivirga]MDT0630846.1 universal stress protein [Rubrivirga sp. F394]MDT7857398.1 universal stress protein [Rubrivirga sp. S365]